MWQFVFAQNLWLIRFLQIILGSLSCAVLFLVGEKLFSRPAGIAVGILLAGYAQAIFFDGLIEESVLDMTLLSLLMFVLITRADDECADFGAGGFIVALVSIFASGVCATGSLAPLFLAGVLLVLFPVGVRNLIVGGEFKLTTSQFGPNFYIGNNPAADGTYGSIRNMIGETQLEGPDAKSLAERKLGRELTPGEVSSYWSRQALECIKGRP